MELAEAYRLIEVFKEKAAAKRQEDRWAIEQQIQFDDDRKKKREQHVREKEEKERLEAMVLASVQQIETFSGQLDTYDTATVQALMHNGAALDDLRHRRDALEGSAYRLPDGQIAIKSDDGKRALDRHGAELPSGTVDPDAIPDALPRWSSFKALNESEEKLARERHDILLFQQRLDATRETIGKGHVTADALAGMDDDLRRSMPDAVKASLPDATATKAAPTIQGAAEPVISRPPLATAPVMGGP